jgi:hypothetical protein
MKMNSTNGPWDSIAALQSALPAASNAGSVQNVGAQPYMAVNGAWVPMGLTYPGSTISPVLGSSIINQLPKFKAGLQRVAQRNGGPVIILMHGDSRDAGLGVGTGANGFVGARKSTIAAQIARMLGWSDTAFLGLPCGTDVAPELYDERISPLGSGVSINQNNAYAGHALIVFAAAASGAFTFTPRSSKGFDRTRIIYGRNTGGATNMAVKVGGNVVGTINSSGTPGVQSVEFAHAYVPPSTPISVSGNGANTDGTFFLIAGIPYDSNDPGVIVLNGGSPGASSIDYTSTGNQWTAAAVVPVLAPELTLLDLWTNDTAAVVTPPATYATKLAQIRAYLVPTSDIIYAGMQPINNVNFANGQGQAIFDAMQAVAAGAPVIDWRTVFGNTYADASALGVFYDALHLLSIGQYRRATYLASLLVN